MTDTVYSTDTRVSSYSDKLGNPTLCVKATKGRTKVQRTTTMDYLRRATCTECIGTIKIVRGR